MADSIVGSMFGPTPLEVQRQRNAQMDQRADQLGEIGFSNRGYVQAGGMLGDAIGGAMGYEPPEVTQAKNRQQLAASVDTNDPDSLMQGAQRIQGTDPGLAAQMVALARKLKAEQINQAQVTAKAGLENAQAAKALSAPTGTSEMQNAAAMADAAGLQRGTPAWQKAYQDNLGNVVKNPNLEANAPSVKEYEYAKANGYKGSFQDWIKTKAQAIHISTGAAIAPITKDGIDLAIDSAKVGDPSLLQSWGRSPSTRAQIINRMAERVKAGEFAPQDIALAKAGMAGLTSSERTLGTLNANIQSASNETLKITDVVREKAAKVDLSKYPDINTLENAVTNHTGGPEVVGLANAINAKINTYARAINPKGIPTVEDKKHARELLNQAMSKGQIQEALDTMDQETKISLAAPPETRDALRKTFLSGQKNTPAATAGGIPSGATMIGKTPDGRPVYQTPDGKKWVQ